MKPEGRCSLTSEKQKELESKFDATIKGGMEEESVYDKLRECLEKNRVKNTVVINGWKDKGTGKLEKSHPLYREQKEFDFLIVSQPVQTIIHIEVKRTCTGSSYASASKQLQNGLEMFRETIPFPGIVKWKYIKVIYFGLSEKGIYSEDHSSDCIQEEKPFENKCRKCQNFIIGPATDFNVWWKAVIAEVTTDRVPDQSDDTYLNVLSFLLHQMYKQQDCATSSQLVKETSKTSDEICNADTIIFWSKEQYKTLKDFSDTKVALTSGFGTGKTILIRAKVHELIAAGQNSIVIVIFESSAEKTILRMEYENIFDKVKDSVKIESISGGKGNQVYIKNVWIFLYLGSMNYNFSIYKFCYIYHIKISFLNKIRHICFVQIQYFHCLIIQK
jgi:hypothetical protein